MRTKKWYDMDNLNKFSRYELAKMINEYFTEKDYQDHRKIGKNIKEGRPMFENVNE